MLLLHEELVAVLLEKPADPRGRERRAPRERMVHDRHEIEVLDHLERPPDLLPAATQIWISEHIHERAFEGRHAYGAAGVRLLHDTTAQAGSPSSERGGRTPTKSLPWKLSGRAWLRVSTAKRCQTE